MADVAVAGPAEAEATLTTRPKVRRRIKRAMTAVMAQIKKAEAKSVDVVVVAVAVVPAAVAAPATTTVAAETIETHQSQSPR